jgi:hypothetical protein
LTRGRKSGNRFGNDGGGWILGARLQVVFDWLYAGHDGKAWAFLAREMGVAEVPNREKENLLRVLNKGPFYRDVRQRRAAEKKTSE